MKTFIENLSNHFFNLLTLKEALNSLIIVLLLLILAGLEILSISLLLPFTALITSNDNSDFISDYLHIFNFFGMVTQKEILIGISFILISVFLFKSAAASFIDYKRIMFSKKIEENMMSRVLNYLLGKDYFFFKNNPPSELYHRLVGEVPQAAKFYGSLLLMISELFVLAFMLALFLFVDFSSTIILISFYALVFSSIFALVRKKIEDLANKRIKYGLARGRFTQQSFNGIKDLKILNNESFFVEYFKKYNYNFLISEASIEFIQQIQYRLGEMLAFVGVILLISFFIFIDFDRQSLIPLLALYTAGTIRLLPSMIKILRGASELKNSNKSMNVVREIIQDDLKIRNLQEKLDKTSFINDRSNKIQFKKSIEISIENFFYEDSKEILNNFTLKIDKNSMIGLVGGSGSGKTTLIDILLGLNPLIYGSIMIDGKELNHKNFSQFRNNIGYVPQRVFLFDMSIKENIALGIDKENIDLNLINKVLDLTQLTSFVSGLPEGLDTIVGENGVKVSGGQLQRIGIARALYYDPEIIILDEATSSLDNKTELNFMESIKKLKGKKTFLVSAHRLSAIEICDQVNFLETGTIKASGTFQDLMVESQEFRKLINKQDSDVN